MFGESSHWCFTAFMHTMDTTTIITALRPQYNLDCFWIKYLMHTNVAFVAEYHLVAVLPSGERHTSQTTSSSYSMPRPSSVSMACFMFCWHLLSSSTTTCSMVSSSSSGSAETHNETASYLWVSATIVVENMEEITKSSHENLLYNAEWHGICQILNE